MVTRQPSKGPLGSVMAPRFRSSEVDKQLEVLREWAGRGAELSAARRHRIPDWTPLHRMIELAREKLAGDAERLRSLLAESRKWLSPLEDPFDSDLGLHRWLQPDREEAYSDWLEWVLRQAKTPAQLFRLFNLGDPPSAVAGLERFEIEREACIPHGHEDQEGRLDLAIRYRDIAIIVVEIKKGNAEGADTVKHGGYNRWLESQSHRCKYRVLIAASAEEATYDDFRFLSWGAVCVEMRRLAVDVCKDGRVTQAAMILAFVAAVEQNLLGFSAEIVREICKGGHMLFNVAVVDHLEQFIRRLEE